MVHNLLPLWHGQDPQCESASHARWLQCSLAVGCATTPRVVGRSIGVAEAVRMFPEALFEAFSVGLPCEAEACTVLRTY